EVIDYYPFGESRIDEKSTTYANDYTFTGKELDEDTKLYYYEARYYNPKIARFVSQDPWEGDLKDPQSLNKYAYVRNNPLKYVDPRGLLEVAWDKVAKFFESETEDLNAVEDFLTLGAYSNAIESVKEAGSRIAEEGLNLETGTNLAKKVVGGAAEVMAGALATGIIMGATANMINGNIADETAVDSPTTNTSTQLALPEPKQPEVGDELYRLSGGGSDPSGSSWGPTDPNNLQDPNRDLGLPDANTAIQLNKGIVLDNSNVIVRPALPYNNRPDTGGATEYFFPNKNDVKVIHSEPFKK
ncbi:RHS repeat-associated core domain-containing protein, partial [Candidatus Peregrinibacteria bacterium]|nr:RHS repeat-associated core domain-containing protein [Candidatus Peregrinibacteria bacterium]